MSQDDLNSLSADERIDRIADHFERCFGTDQQQSIEQMVDRCPPAEKDSLLEELVATELQLRGKRGDRVDVSDYVNRFPGVASIIRKAFEIGKAGGPVAVSRPDGEPEQSDEIESIGRFQVIRQIGKGGFGNVYHALDPQLKREVAIKVPLRDSIPADETMQSMLREAQAAAQLNHPAIVAIHEVLIDDGTPAIVYDYVEGQDLASWVSSKDRSFAELIEVIDQLAVGLAHAHERGVIHCDLKLANVLVDSENQPRVTDFGLAVFGADRISGMGGRFGTPIAMAPEQVRGWCNQVDERTDIWGMGVMLFQLLTGKPPFESDDRQSLFKQIAEQPVDAPFVNTELYPLQLQQLCCRCLAKDPKDRFESFDAFQKALGKVHPQQIKTVSMARLDQPVNARSSLVSATVQQCFLLGLVLLVLFGFGWSLWNRIDHDKYVDTLVQRLETAGLQSISPLVDEFSDAGDAAVKSAAESLLGPQATNEVRLKVGLVSLGRSATAERLIEESVFTISDPDDVQSVRDVLSLQQNELNSFFWSTALSESSSSSRFLITASLLAGLDPNNGANWRSISARLAQELTCQGSTARPTWVRLFRPVSDYLLDDLTRLLNAVDDSDRSEAQTDATIEVLAIYASKDRDRLAELVLTADTKRFKKFAPILFRYGEAAKERLKAELQQQPRYSHLTPDSFADSVPEPTRRSIQQSDGIVTPRFVVCLGLEKATLEQIHAPLEKAGYWLKQARPYVSNQGTRIAAIWRCDIGKTFFELDLDKETFEKRFSKYNKGFLLLDVAGYLTETDGIHEERFVGVWKSRPASLPRTNQQAYAGVPQSQHWKKHRELARAGLTMTQSVHAYTDRHGHLKFSGVQCANTNHASRQVCVSLRELMMSADSGLPTGDLIVCAAPNDLSWKTRWQQRKDDWADPEDHDVFLQFELHRFVLGQACFYLGQDDSAIRWLDQLIDKRRHTREAYRLRALLHARAGRKSEAFRDLRMLERLNETPIRLQGTRVWVAAHLDLDRWPVRTVDKLIQDRDRDAWTLYDAAGIYARTAAIVAGRDQTKSNELSDQSISLLQRAVDHGFSDSAHLQLDWRFGSLSERPEFISLIDQMPPGRVFTRLRKINARDDIEVTYGDASLRDSIRRFQRLASDGYLPQNLCVSELSDGPLATSTWVRRRPSDAWGEAVENRKANAAIALYQMGDRDPVWQTLRFSPDPGVRTKTILRLGKFGSLPGPLIERLTSEDDVGAGRSIILSLGRCQLSPTEKLQAKNSVTKLFRSDPDAGVHAAADWLLRRWDREAGGRGATIVLDDSSFRPDRTWYQTKTHGHTLTIVDGPVEFLRGKADADLGAIDVRHEIQTPVRINRTFAIATKEVTVAQYSEFLKDLPQSMRRLPQGINRDPQAAIAKPFWIHAMLYCHWLNKREGVPEDQWTLPKLAENHTAPIHLPANYLQRTGYRLPTNAEFQYANRAGTTTSRFYGSSQKDLEHFSWHLENSRQSANPVGQLMPNDFGLFDTLGNLAELGMERYQSVYALGPCGDDIEDTDPVHVTNPSRRVLASNGFANPASSVKIGQVAGANAYAFGGSVGFRIARTLRDYRPPPIDDE